MAKRDNTLLWIGLGVAAVALLGYGAVTGNSLVVCALTQSVWPNAWLTLGSASTYVPTINAIEQQFGIPTNLLAAVAYQESRFNPSAVNASSGATGMFQLLPRYYPNAGKDWTADAQTAAGALVGYYNEFGDWQSALAAYNWGPGNLHASGADTLAQLPQETQGYVSAVAAATGVQGPFVAVA